MTDSRRDPRVIPIRDAVFYMAWIGMGLEVYFSFGDGVWTVLSRVILVGLVYGAIGAVFARFFNWGRARWGPYRNG